MTRKVLSIWRPQVANAVPRTYYQEDPDMDHQIFFFISSREEDPGKDYQEPDISILLVHVRGFLSYPSMASVDFTA